MAKTWLSPSPSLACQISGSKQKTRLSNSISVLPTRLARSGLVGNNIPTLFQTISGDVFHGPEKCINCVQYLRYIKVTPFFSRGVRPWHFGIKMLTAKCSRQDIDSKMFTAKCSRQMLTANAHGKNSQQNIYNK